MPNLRGFSRVPLGVARCMDKTANVGIWGGGPRNPGVMGAVTSAGFHGY